MEQEDTGSTHQWSCDLISVHTRKTTWQYVYIYALCTWTSTRVVYFVHILI